MTTFNTSYLRCSWSKHYSLFRFNTILWLLLSLLFLGGCSGLPSKSLSSSAYENRDYGFSITPPQGWYKSLMGSAEINIQLQSRDKNALAIIFLGPDKVDPIGESLLISFLSDDPQIRTLEDSKKYLTSLIAKQAPNDKLYKSKVLSIGGYPAVHTETCVAFEGARECNLIENTTEIFLQGGKIQIQFSIHKGLYPNYKNEISQSLATIHLIPGITLKQSPTCQESDIKMMEHHWKPDIHTIELPSGVNTRKNKDSLTTINLVWNVTVKNESQNKCLITMAYQLEDSNGEELYLDKTLAHTLGPQETATIKGISLRTLENKILYKIDSAQPLIFDIQ